MEHIASDERAFAAFLGDRFEPAEYLRRYPDVAAARVDPLTHWLEWGMGEGRVLCASLVVRPADSLPPELASRWTLFSVAGQTVAARFSHVPLGELVAHYPAIQPNDELFAEFVLAHLDPDEYLARNPDVASDGARGGLRSAERLAHAAAHWLRWGMREGRALAPDLTVTWGADLRGRRPPRAPQGFDWQGEAVAVSTVTVSASILHQIEAQGCYDPALFAPGATAIRSLPRFVATDLWARDRVDVEGIFSAMCSGPDTVVAIPFLVPGGAEKYAADIVDVLANDMGRRVQIVVTDQTEHEAGEWWRLHALRPLRAAHLVFWKDISEAGDQITVFARMLNAIRPKYLLVVNSRLGLDAVSVFGRGLSQNTTILCAYFSLSPGAVGAPCAARFPRQTLPHAIALTDNRPMADYFNAHFGSFAAKGVVCLPARQLPAPRAIVQNRWQQRASRLVQHGRVRRWLWLSRLEPFKGTSILARLASARPHDAFQVHGPGGERAAALGLDQPNVVVGGVVEDVPGADLTGYDAFLFTSRFEGMPNTVLEMTQHALPLVLADVGGLRDTLSPSCAEFVGVQDSDDATSARFLTAMDRLASKSVDDLKVMVEAAYEHVVSRHSPEAHASRLRDLFA